MPINIYLNTKNLEKKNRKKKLRNMAFTDSERESKWDVKIKG